MSGLKVETLQREFFYNGSRIPDPAPNLSVEQVRDLLAPTILVQDSVFGEFVRLIPADIAISSRR